MKVPFDFRVKKTKKRFLYEGCALLAVSKNGSASAFQTDQKNIYFFDREDRFPLFFVSFDYQYHRDNPLIAFKYDDMFSGRTRQFLLGCELLIELPFVLAHAVDWYLRYYLPGMGYKPEMQFLMDDSMFMVLDELIKVRTT